MVVLTCIAFYTYTGGPVESIFNKISSQRFYTINQVFHLVPIEAFQSASILKDVKFPFDYSYGYLLLVFGYVPTFFFLSLILLGLYVANNRQEDVCLVSLVIATLIYGFLESLLIDVTISFPVVKVIADMPSTLLDIHRDNQGA